MFERRLEKEVFYADPMGHGVRKFGYCTLLHKMIAEHNLEGIMERKEWLTEKALDMRGIYDHWSDCTPLWMVVKFRGSRWVQLIELMLKNGAKKNCVPNNGMGRSTSILSEAVKEGQYAAAEMLLKYGAAVGPSMDFCESDKMRELFQKYKGQ